MWVGEQLIKTFEVHHSFAKFTIHMYENVPVMRC